MSESSCARFERQVGTVRDHLRTGGFVREGSGALYTLWSVNGNRTVRDGVPDAELHQTFIDKYRTAEHIARHICRRAEGFGWELECLPC